MTITVTAVPAGTPPRVDLSVSVPVGGVMQSVSVFRTSEGVRELIRQQPSAGFDERTVSDFEMPYDANLIYSWGATYTDASESVTVWSEDWADLSAWSGDLSQASVSGGVMTLSGGGFPVSIDMDITATDWDSIEIASLTQVTAPGSGVLLLGLGSVDMAVSTGGNLRVNGWATPIDPTEPFTITQMGASVLVQGSGGESTVQFTYAPLTHAYISAGDGVIKVGGITISTGGTEYSVSETAGLVTVSPKEGWLIHPGKPALSVPLGLRGSAAGVKELNAISAESTTTLHYPMGSSRPVAVNSGPRLADALEMVVTTVTMDELTAIRGLLRDQTPILIRFPASHDMEFEEGFYSVGRLGINRLAQIPGLSLRHVSLPLTATGSPIVSVESAGWSWAALAAEFPTWESVAEAFETWADVATNTRRA